jgi:hypothetical protein
MSDRRSRTDAILLLDMALAAQDAINFLEGLDELRFFDSALHQNAVVRALAIMGEAANNVATPFRDEHPGLPWREIIGLRHRLVHDYADIHPELIWTIVRDRLPDLVIALNSLIAPDPGAGV